MICPIQISHSVVVNKAKQPESPKTKTKILKKKAASDNGPGKAALSEFPSNIQMFAKRVRPHFKASLAISFEKSLQKDNVSYVWDLLKKFVKDSPPVHAVNDKKAFKLLKDNPDIQKRFIDFVSTSDSCNALCCRSCPLLGRSRETSIFPGSHHRSALYG